MVYGVGFLRIFWLCKWLSYDSRDEKIEEQRDEEHFWMLLFWVAKLLQ